MLYSPWDLDILARERLEGGRQRTAQRRLLQSAALERRRRAQDHRLSVNSDQAVRSRPEAQPGES